MRLLCCETSACKSMDKISRARIAAMISYRLLVFFRFIIFRHPSLWRVRWSHQDGGEHYNLASNFGRSGACFSKVPKLFGSLSGATIPFISSQRRGSKPSNFAILLIFLVLKTCKKISFSKQADCSLTTSFSGPKSSRDFRETGPRSLFYGGSQGTCCKLKSCCK